MNSDNGVIRNCVAVNYRIYGGNDVGRVAGINEPFSGVPGILTNNFARSDIQMRENRLSDTDTGTARTTFFSDPNDFDGEDIPVSSLTSTWWQTAVLFSATYWIIPSTGLPTLRNMPGRTQDPQIRNN